MKTILNLTTREVVAVADVLDKVDSQPSLPLSSQSLDSLWLLLEDLQNGVITTNQERFQGYISALDEVIMKNTIQVSQ